VIGIGTDLVEVDRFRSVLQRTPGIVDRLFTSDEMAYAALCDDPSERLAVRFAAKEAVMKAMGAGIGDVSFVDIEVVRAESGEPSVVLHGRARERARQRGVSRWLLTLTHTHTLAHAIAVALGEERA
jgi:holo-[acyl-carrier protein] synthase